MKVWQKPKGNKIRASDKSLVYHLLWSSFFVTLVAKKYHDSVILSSALREGWHNC